MEGDLGKTIFVRNLQRMLAKAGQPSHEDIYRPVEAGVLMKYQIRLPLSGGEGTFTLCTCESPEKLAEVIRILLEADRQSFSFITIYVMPQ